MKNLTALSLAAALLSAAHPASARRDDAALVTRARLIGIDHVGISSDFGGGGIDGWNCTVESFNVELELVRRGYTEEQVGKLWSGNLLRVWGDVQKTAQTLQKAQK